MAEYEVRQRPQMQGRRRQLLWPFRLKAYPPPLKRPWALYRDGKPIGFYETKEAAAEAAPSA